MTGTWYLVPVIYLYCRAVLIHLAGTAMNLERIRSNLSKTKNIPPKALILSDFCCTFAMSLMIMLVLICSTKVSEKSDMAKS